MQPSAPVRAAVPPRTPAQFDSAPWVLGALALWLLCTLGLRPLLLPDEGRYATVAREMLAGDGWVPTLNGLPFFHKPPLVYWLDMVFMRIFGINEFAVRVGPALGGWLMGAALYLALRHWHGGRAATIGVVVLATCPLFFLSAQYVNHDMLVAGLITVAVCAFARAVDAPPRVHPGWVVMGWVACALAMLAKGLIGFVLPALVMAPWLLRHRRWSQMWRLLHPLAVLAALLVGAPWFVAMQMRYPGFFDYFFVEQHFRRFAETGFNNVQPFWFFLLVLPALTLPWSLRLPQALRRAWTAAGPTGGLLLWWTVAVVLFFSLPSSKIVGYVLPALAPWSVLLAMTVTGRSVRFLGWFAGLSALLCLALVAGFVWQQPAADRTVARALSARMAPGDRVVMLDEYLYDVPFYAQLQQPVIILSDWADPQLPRRDNWRRELFDAAQFDPAQGADVLRPLKDLPRIACGTGQLWFVMRQRGVPAMALVPQAQRVLALSGVELWKAAPKTCP